MNSVINLVELNDDEALAFEPEHKSIPLETPRIEIDIISAADLQRKKFPPIQFIIPRLLPPGLLLFAAPPKIGKSWLGLDAAIAIALGGEFLGIECKQGDVLFIGLEDSQRRVSERLGKLLPGTGWPERLTIATKWPRADQGGIDKIKEWAASCEKPSLVVIDVLTLFRAERRANSQVYEEDYRGIKPIQELAHDLAIGIVCIHHTRKQASDDAFQQVSGSTAMTGAVDGTLMLLRTSSGTELHLQHRDLEGFEKAVQFDKWSCRWSLLGDANEVRRSDERTQILDYLIGSDEPLGPNDIAAELGVSQVSTRQTLLRMVKAGEIRKAGRGKYLHPDVSPPVTSVTKSHSQHSTVAQSDNVTDVTGLSGGSA